MINLILAVDENFCIGKNNQLCWDLKKDLKYFSEKTKNQVVIMGKNTFLSLPKKFRPLPNRINIIVSKSLKENQKNLFIKPSLTEAINFSKQFNKEIFLIGGKRIYEEGIHFADKIYLTQIFDSFDCDTCLSKDFENNLSKNFKLTKEKKDQENGLNFSFKVWEKVIY